MSTPRPLPTLLLSDAVDRAIARSETRHDRARVYPDREAKPERWTPPVELALRHTLAATDRETNHAPARVAFPPVRR